MEGLVSDLSNGYIKVICEIFPASSAATNVNYQQCLQNHNH